LLYRAWIGRGLVHVIYTKSLYVKQANLKIHICAYKGLATKSLTEKTIDPTSRQRRRPIKKKSEFLTANLEVPSSIPGTTRFFQ
jgi:hypothetical protein